MEDSSCNKAGPERLDSCYVWIYSMLGETNSSLPTACVGVCAIFPQEIRSTMKQCVIMFSLAALPVCVFGFVCVCASSPSSDPGLSRNAGSGARCICQPPLPRRRHPKSQAPLAEERHGPAAQIVQTALSHRWGQLKCCQHTIRFSRYRLSHLVGAVFLNCTVLHTNSTAEIFVSQDNACGKQSLKNQADDLSNRLLFLLVSSNILLCFSFIYIPYGGDETKTVFILLLWQNKHTFSLEVNEKDD